MDNLKRQMNNKTMMNSSSNQNASKRGNQNNLAQQQEMEMKLKELEDEMGELNQNMDDTIKKCIVDFINLVFGAGKETNEFWENVLLPYTASYYSFPFEELVKQTRNLNAIFFAFITHTGIKIIRANPKNQNSMQDPRG